MYGKDIFPQFAFPKLGKRFGYSDVDNESWDRFGDGLFVYVPLNWTLKAIFVLFERTLKITEYDISENVIYICYYNL